MDAKAWRSVAWKQQLGILGLAPAAWADEMSDCRARYEDRASRAPQPSPSLGRIKLHAADVHASSAAACATAVAAVALWSDTQEDMGGYRRGMLEVCTVLAHVLHADAAAAVAQDGAALAEVSPALAMGQDIAADCFAMFSALMERCAGLYEGLDGEGDGHGDGHGDGDAIGDGWGAGAGSALAGECAAAIELLRLAEPFLWEHLECVGAKPADYLSKWLRSLLATALKIEELLLVWDALLEDLPSMTAIETAGPPLLHHLCVSMLIENGRLLYATNEASQVLELLRSWESIDDAGHSPSGEAVAERARCIRDPFRIAISSASRIEVIEFGEGPLGIVMRKSRGGTLVVNGFQRSPDGTPGQAERSGRVAPEDVLYAVNGVAVRKGTSARQIVDLIRRVGKPVYVAFERAVDSGSIYVAPQRSQPSPSTSEAAETPQSVASPPGAASSPPPLPPPRPTRTPVASAPKAPTPASAARCADGFMPLLAPGEMCAAVCNVEGRSLERRGPGNSTVGVVRVAGKLVATNYRVLFHRYVSSERALGRGLSRNPRRSATFFGDQSGGEEARIYRDWETPVHMLQKVQLSKSGGFLGDAERTLELHCKNGQVVLFSAKRRIAGSLQELTEVLSAMAFKDSSCNGVDFPFTHFTALKAIAPPDRSRRTHLPLLADYDRLGLTNCRALRVINQDQLLLCETYPQYLVVPSQMSDVELHAVTHYRSKQRLQSVVYKDAPSGATLSRCAQPLVGLQSNRSAEDERLVAQLANGRKMYIVDARPKLSTQGNRLMGKGTELAKFYEGCELLFMNIGNIHAVRESWQQVMALTQPAADGDSAWLGHLAAAGWLDHVQRILGAAARIATLLRSSGSSVLVHCSDGWDRTPQLTSLAQLLLDPYYRTLEGFATLVEKEWLAFGHMFARRHGHGSGDHGDEQRAPIFVLWLDCVWQLTRQFPGAFEFNGKYLLALADQSYACRCGSFLFNSDRERLQNFVRERSLSVWDYLLDLGRDLENEAFVPFAAELIPNLSAKNLVLWKEYFQRFDDSLIPKVERCYFY